MTGRISKPGKPKKPSSLLGELAPCLRIVPADATIADLEEKARDAALAAEGQPEPEATCLRELAAQCREWAAALRSKAWIP